MPRKIRVQFPGAIYHVMNRGDRREAIFHSDKDRKLFLATLGEACQKTGWEVHAYCLMPNHFHLVVETPSANLVQGMKWLLGTYTARFNRRHKYFGHLFSGRYKAVLISGSPGYLRTACHYVHLNPARARLLLADEPLSAFRWSSYPDYLKAKVKVEIAQFLRAHTPMTIRWVAERLHMGTAGHLTHLLYWAQRPKRQAQRFAGTGDNTMIPCTDPFTDPFTSTIRTCPASFCADTIPLH